jgi:hypothetical protein
LQLATLQVSVVLSQLVLAVFASAASQLFPHAPQFCSETAVFTHAPLQEVSPTGQLELAHTPP